MRAAAIAGMDVVQPQLPDPTRSDDGFLAACRYLRQSELCGAELLAAWLALQRGWQEHVARHAQYIMPRMMRYEAKLASDQGRRHWEIADRLEQCAIDIRLGNVNAAAASKIMLDALIEHITEAECRFVAPRRRSLAG